MAQAMHDNRRVQVLVAAYDQSARRHLSNVLRTLGADRVFEATSMTDALTLVDRRELDLALISPRLGQDPLDESGLELTAELRSRRELVVLIVGEQPGLLTLRKAMRCGASDWISLEDLDADRLTALLDELRTLGTPRPRPLPKRVPPKHEQPMIGRSPQIVRLREDISRVASTNYPVLITGPSGAGKELVVREIHRLSQRPAAPLLDLNCGAIPEQLLESQLFGHKRGSFTGADRDQEGYLAAVGSGVLFLDEIAEMQLSLQAKLLRVLETGRYRMVGSTCECRFEGRVIAATHADLALRCAKGQFREDLYYRLAVLEIRVPALRDRVEDIPLLLEHFIDLQERAFKFEPAAVARLLESEWPGNIRELRNLVARVALLSDENPVRAATVDRLLRGHEAPRSRDGDELMRFADSVLGLDVEDKLHAAQEVLIARSLARCGGNKSAAARALGVHRKVLERRLGKYDALVQ